MTCGLVKIAMISNVRIGRALFTGCGVVLMSAAAVAVGTPSSAVAGEIEGRAGAATQYLGKGLGKSDQEPAIFGAVRWTSGPVYADVFVSEASSSKGAAAEMIATIGHERDLGFAEVDLQVLYREMIGETAGIDSAYVEYQADVSRAFNSRLSGRLRINYSSNTYGAAEEAWWIEPQVTVKVTGADKVSVAYGRRDLDVGTDYAAWNIGLKHRFSDAVSGDLRWYDTDVHDAGERYEGRLVASLAYAF
jgi:uncharacterized protein (TIGR02001 family)